MKIIQIKNLIACLLLSVVHFASFARSESSLDQAVSVVKKNADKIDIAQDSLITPVIINTDVSSASYVGTTQAAKQTFKTSGKLVKEVYANRNMTFLNNANAYDRAGRLRTTADGVFLAAFGDNEKNPSVDAKMALRLRYDVGAPALVTTAPGASTLGGVALTTPSTSIQKTIFWLRELFLRISFDTNPSESLHYLKFGSFPNELGRGIAFGSAYNSGGFLGLNPRFSIDQFSPGAVLRTDIIKDTLYGELYYSLSNNPNASFNDNIEVIRANEITDIPSKGYRGLHTQAWIVSGLLNWKAINLKDLKLVVNPYTYMYVSPDQKLEFTADSDSQLYLIGTALEYKYGKFEWGVDTAFQGGNTRVKAWDRNYTTIKNNDSVLTTVYTKVYTDDTYTTQAPVSNANKALANAGAQNYTQNGQEIIVNGEGTGLWNAIDRFRPAQKIFYHGYFFVTDMSYELMPKQLKLCADVGYTSGNLDDFEDVNSMTQAQLMHQHFNGFVPVQSVYSGKRIQHLVMLNTGVPRFTVQYPQLSEADFHVQSRITGVSTLTDKFTNLAYVGLALECTPTKFADQKAMIKPAALYYWMVDAPQLLTPGTTASTLTVADATQASHALGAAVSIEFEATIKECLNMGGYVGWMIPGQQYKQFAGTQLKSGTLGSDLAYVLNFTMTYKF